MSQFAQLERSQGRKRRGFQYDTVARRQSWGGFPASNREGKIPRHDTSHHTHRLAQGEVEPAAADGNGLTIEFGHRSGIVLKYTGTQSGLIAGIADGLANVQRFQLGDLFEMSA